MNAAARWGRRELERWGQGFPSETPEAFRATPGNDLTALARDSGEAGDFRRRSAEARRAVEEGMLVGPLIDQQAIAWDVETLSEEQHLVQSLYCALSESDLQDLYEIVELGPVALIDGTFTLPLWVPKGPYNKVNRIPCFKGDKSELKTVEPWWRYGTLLAAHITSLGCKGCRVRCIRHHRRFKSVRYSPGRTYGPAYTRCAENSTPPSNVDYTKVGQLVRSMTPQERGEAMAKSQLMEAFRTRLSDEQYERIPKLMNGE